MFLEKSRIELENGVVKDLYITSPDGINYHTIIRSATGMNFLKKCFIEEWAKATAESGPAPYWHSCAIEFAYDLTSMYRQGAANMNFYTINGSTYLIGFSCSRIRTSKKVLRVLPLP